MEIWKKMGTIAGKILYGAVIFLLLAVILLNLYSAIVRKTTGEPMPMVAGYAAAVVQTVSMEPELHVGDMVIVHKETRYNVGDIVSYRSASGRSAITHKLIAVENGQFITQGTANNVADEPIDPARVYGKVVRILPGAGNPAWRIALVGLAALVLLLPRFVKKE